MKSTSPRLHPSRRAARAVLAYSLLAPTAQLKITRPQGTRNRANRAAVIGVVEQKAPAEANAFAKKVASANTFEIQSSELAKDRSQSSEVKSFADQMIADHTKAGEDFKAAVQAANVSPPPAEEP